MQKKRKKFSCWSKVSIPLSDNRKELSTISEKAMLDRESILEKVRNGVANQIETDREKRISKDDISVK